jgi:hypothetical protein
MRYIAQGNLNIRIHKDITGEMWFEEIFDFNQIHI